MFEYVIRGDLLLLEHWGRICDRNRENQILKKQCLNSRKNKKFN